MTLLARPLGLRRPGRRWIPATPWPVPIACAAWDGTVEPRPRTASSCWLISACMACNWSRSRFSISEPALRVQGSAGRRRGCPRCDRLRRSGDGRFWFRRQHTGGVIGQDRDIGQIAQQIAESDGQAKLALQFLRDLAEEQ